MYAYTRFYGSNEDDYGRATIAARYSADGGRTWSSKDRLLVRNEGRMNVMSVSLLRLQDGHIALFYLCKNGISDNLPYMRISADEGESWGNPVRCIGSSGYYVVNNDRVVQLRSGRLIMPAAYHRTRSTDGTPRSEQHDPRALTMYFHSDDVGRTWHESNDCWSLPIRSESGLQEPGVVELKQGRLYGWARTDTGYQWELRSRDRGDTWTRRSGRGSNRRVRRCRSNGLQPPVICWRSGTITATGGSWRRRGPTRLGVEHLWHWRQAPTRAARGAMLN
ncbi:MAG TPA: hypothetical protein DIT01_01235 [Lentisphaeria bacterium]|nr:hypothetical protein [Lentisphaeria bacterium]|tara:strand:- start:1654 stop:2487 length:834 start_codon:yes stop_codon:yes gene_type:complete